MVKNLQVNILKSTKRNHPVRNPLKLKAYGIPMIPAPTMELIRLEDAPNISLWVWGLLCLQIDLLLVTFLLLCVDSMPEIEDQEEVIEENPF